VDTALTDDGPDLGSGHFRALEQPRIAVLTGPPINFTEFGAIWHLLDQEFQLRISTIDCFRVSWVDLSKYNVLVMPSSWHDPMGYKRMLGSNGVEKIRQWIREGGTLVAIGNGAVFAADERINLSQVALRRQVLDKLAEYERAVAVEKAARDPEINIADIWDPGTGKNPKKSGSGPAEEPPKELSEEELKEQDTWTHRFMPRGVILRGNVDREHWLGFGLTDNVPFIVYTPYALLSKPPVATAVRFAEEKNLRVSGLLWPEARKRWADTAYLTREGLGKGQVILFAGPPDFRSYFHGTRRLFLNTLFLGPGFGTHRPAPW
jgi:hypothetical protein